MAKFFREEDTMIITALRGISIGVLATPLIIFYSIFSGYYPTLEILKNVLPATLFAVISTVSIGEVFKQVSVSLTMGWCLSSYTVFSWLIDVLYTSSFPTFYQNIGILFLILSILFISFDNKEPNLITKRAIFFSLLFGFFASSSNFIVGIEGNRSDPFLAGYVWEFSIGILALLFSAKKMSRIKITKYIKGVSISSSPTIFGTGLFMFATTIGPIGICSAILSSQLIFSSIIAKIAYSEPLSKRKIIGIFMVTTSIMILRLG